MKKVLRWTNKMSREQGYVKNVSRAYGNFINTWEQAEAKIYRSDKQVEKDLVILNEIGETINNEFEALEIE